MQCVICEKDAPEEQIEKAGMCKECEGTFSRTEDALEGKPGDESDPEIRKAIALYHKRREYMKKYNSKPDVAEKRREYMRNRQRRERELIKKARQLGLL
jgi:hypothetical protein